MSNLFMPSDVKDSVGTPAPKKSGYDIDDYLEMELSRVYYNDLDLDELARCEPLNRFVNMVSFWYKYNGRRYDFMIFYSGSSGNRAHLVQNNKSDATDISKSEFQHMVRMIAERYGPFEEVNIKDQSHISGPSTQFIIEFRGKIFESGADVSSFRDDIEQYFKPKLRNIKNINVAFNKLKLRQIMNTGMNPKKLLIG